MQGKEWLSVGGGCRGKDWPERRRGIRRALFEKSVNVERARWRRGEDGILVSFDGHFVPLPGSKFIYLTRPLGLKIYMKI